MQWPSYLVVHVSLPLYRRCTGSEISAVGHNSFGFVCRALSSACAELQKQNAFPALGKGILLGVSVSAISNLSPFVALIVFFELEWLCSLRQDGVLPVHAL